MSGEGKSPIQPPDEQASKQVGQPSEATCSSAPQSPAEVIRKLPPEFRQVFAAAMSGPMPHPLIGKIDSEHMHKMIDLVDKDSEREFRSSTSGRRYAFAVFVLATVVVVFLLIFFTTMGKPDYVFPLITALVGAAGGYGVGLSRGRKSAAR